MAYAHEYGGKSSVSFHSVNGVNTESKVEKADEIIRFKGWVEAWYLTPLMLLEVNTMIKNRYLIVGTTNWFPRYRSS